MNSGIQENPRGLGEGNVSSEKRTGGGGEGKSTLTIQARQKKPGQMS